MKRLVVIPFAVFERGNDEQQNAELLEKITELARRLKEKYKEYLAEDVPSKGRSAFKEVYIVCSESPAAQRTADIFEKELGIKISVHQELCSTDGHANTLKTLHGFIAAQRSEVVVMISDENYCSNYPGYFTIMNNYRKPLNHVELSAGQALVINNDKTDDGYGMSEIISAEIPVLAGM